MPASFGVSAESLWRQVLDHSDPASERTADLEEQLTLLFMASDSTDRQALAVSVSDLIIRVVHGELPWLDGISGLLLSADPLLLGLDDDRRDALVDALAEFLSDETAPADLTPEMAFYAHQVLLVCKFRSAPSFWLSAVGRFGPRLLPITVAGLAQHGLAPVLEFLTGLLPDTSVAEKTLRLLPGLAAELGTEEAERVAYLIAPSLSDLDRHDLWDLLDELNSAAPMAETQRRILDPDVDTDPTAAAAARGLEALMAVAHDNALGGESWQRIARAAEAAVNALRRAPTSTVVLDRGYATLRSTTVRLLVTLAELGIPALRDSLLLLVSGLRVVERIKLVDWALAFGRLTREDVIPLFAEDGLFLPPQLGTNPLTAESPRRNLAAFEYFYRPQPFDDRLGLEPLNLEARQLPITHEGMVERWAALLDQVH